MSGGREESQGDRHNRASQSDAHAAADHADPQILLFANSQASKDAVLLGIRPRSEVK